MEYDEFMAFVGQAIGGDRDAAERATRATFETLAEHLGADESRHLVTQLSPELSAWLYAVGPAEGFDVDEFVRRVAEREQADPETATRHARGVFLALGRALSDREFAHLRARLPRDFAALLPKGTYAGPPSADDIVTRVAAIRNRRHVGTVRSETPDSEELAEAQRATEALLDTLAERIAPGDVEDLIARLPIPMHAALKRGMAQADDVSRRMPAEEFVARVARRAGIDVEQARGYAHAVLSTLRELVPEEFFDVTVQLPDEYWVRLEID